MEWLGLGKKPISTDTPAGTDVTYVPIFERLNEEVKKLGSPTAGAVDWGQVRDLAAGILRNQSKHYLVACYLCVALLRLEGWRGFAGGVQVLREMIGTYWQEGFPPIQRMRGRRNALNWWREQVDAALETVPTEEWEPSERQTLLDNLREIDTLLADRLEDGPMLRSLITAVGNRITEPVAPASPEAPATPPHGGKTASQPPGPEATPSPPPPPATRKVEVVPDHDLPPEKNLDKGCTFLALAATQYLGKNPFHPLSFRLNRLVSWLSIDTLPPATESHTLLPPPDPQQQSMLKGLYQANNWQSLLAAAEPLTRQYLFWLDLSRYVGESLQRLAQKDAAHGVVAETLLFTRRLPGIEKLCFSDGTPFADQSTREWLKEQEPSQESGADSVSAGMDETLAARLTEAQTRGKENPNEGLGLFSAGLNNAANGREEFLWRQELCRFLCRQQQPQLALPYAERLLSRVTDHQLEEWEPSLAEAALETVLNCLRLQAGESQQTKISEVFQRLALLNPSRAMEML